VFLGRFRDIITKHSACDVYKAAHMVSQLRAVKTACCADGPMQVPMTKLHLFRLNIYRFYATSKVRYQCCVNRECRISCHAIVKGDGYGLEIVYDR